MALITSQIALVSVVIPAYNRAKTIRYCLDSVLKQTLSPFEIIVVDDCSTDETVEIVRGYPDPMVRCIVLENNSGAQAARNRGIQEACGEWIAFQDSDDEWLAEKLEKQVAKLAEVNFNPMTVVHTDCNCLNYRTGESKSWDLPLIDGVSVFTKLLTSSGPLFPTILTSKIALEKIGFLDESVPSYQEWDTSIRLAQECQFIHIREPLFIYHLHGGETISKNHKRDIDGYQYVIDKFREEIIYQCGINVLNDHLSGNAFKALCLGFYTDASEILAKTVGSSFRSCILKRMVRYEINGWFFILIYKSINMLCTLSTRFVSRL
jgi:glycosyltransferase involved in cell wall biosynthesis